MSLALNDNLSQSRKRALDAWFVANGIKKKDVAKELDITPQQLSQFLNSQYTKLSVYEKLCSVELGEEGFKIPKHLVPLPTKAQKTGPKARVA
ncbi:helix-turn-helix domain-containing protein [Maridesulfovibrio frigidus]|uniref:helix-turn-helix domain-containing protein n=1 Tax=Maridesulfovibrio frigidus TaxID=340956 RepID=UPI0012ECAD88|nr:helix-turn-helix domain-containing protein [Maridesulfovibrio frigidus]